MMKFNTCCRPWRVSLKKIILILPAATLSACSWLFGDEGVWPPKPDPYLVVEEREALQYPQTVQAIVLSEEYLVPNLEISQALPKKFKLPRLTPLQSVSQRGSVRIQSMGDEEWILINSPPALVWPQLKTFFTSNDIRLLVEEGSTGLMETDWLLLSEDDNPANTDELSKARFRIQLKAGVQRDTAELYIDRISSGTPVEMSDEMHLETKNIVMRQLAEYLANSPGEQSYSLLAQGITTASKVNLVMMPEAAPYINLQLPYDRGWASVLLALKKASYQVRDLDRSQGTIFARRLSREEIREAEKRAERKEGFWGRLFLGDEEAPDALNDFRFTIDSAKEHLEIRIDRVSEQQLEHAEKAFLLKQLQGYIS